jgi:acrylyl-CoA reductase (NADPH)
MLWDRLGGEWKPPHLDVIIRREVDLDGMSDVFDDLLAGGGLGRSVVRIDPSQD